MHEDMASYTVQASNRKCFCNTLQLIKNLDFYYNIWPSDIPGAWKGKYFSVCTNEETIS